jgi:hypothetical protein
VEGAAPKKDTGELAAGPLATALAKVGTAVIGQGVLFDNLDAALAASRERRRN